ncbi:hypothetical protein Aduo_015549 [Ancylostoma duodenale]
MSTGDFLNALRRFIARRGVPRSITSDNAPTFLLTAEILADGATATKLDPAVVNTAAHYEIEWRNITPYAPWQGGFYERLIKSVKHSLYKSLRGKPLRSIDNLATFLTEVESCLNSRPLTYQNSEHDDILSIRPIDFIQRDLIISFPYECSNTFPSDDPDYLPPGEARVLATRKEVEEALRSSCNITEQFWQVWHEHYLTSLRETHKKYYFSKRHSSAAPKIGAVVLISDPVLPRNDWKLGRISNVRPGTDGQVREVELITATKRKIRRPVNPLVPLEIKKKFDKRRQR